MNELVFFPFLHNDKLAEDLKLELEARENQLAELELELNTLKKNLNAFEILYHQHLSEHYARLDNLKLDLLEMLSKYQKGLVSTEELDSAREQAQRSNTEFQGGRSSTAQALTEQDFMPTENLKELYRKAVKLMHPDLANNHNEKALRTTLLSQINAAYAKSDEEALREILRHWQEGADFTLYDNDELTVIYRRTIFAVKAIKKIQEELRILKRDKLTQLWQASQDARKEGRDLLEEIAREIIQETVNILTTMKKLAR